MGDIEYWYLKCKLCSHFHRGDVVDRSGPSLNVPFDAVIECPNSPGQTAEYHLGDWRPMTESQLLELQRKNTAS